ncbi:MAG: hypothetical protein QOJ01_939 [Solirubrobacterales bacterium]|nr:hypothetical protein [Solirubrobacterales bacterium]
MRLSGTKLIVALLAFAAAFTAAPALAATIKVNTTADEYGSGTACSLREAISAAESDAAFGGCTAGSGPDTIQLQGGKTYIRELPGPADNTNATGDYDVAGEMTIAVKGKGQAKIDAGGMDRVLQILPGAKLTASHLTLTNGDVAPAQPGSDTSGGGISDAGILKLSKSTIVKNKTLGNNNCTCGGGLSVLNGTAKLDKVKILKNTADNIGGGIAFTGGKLDVNRTTIDKNTSTSGGGGVYLGGDVGANTAAFRNSTISRNTDTDTGPNGGGGGVFVANFTNSTFTFTNSTFAGNSANGYGGAIFVYQAGGINLSYSTVTGNTANADADATGHGGGLAGGDITAGNSIVDLNFDASLAAPLPDCALGASVTDGVISQDGGCVGSHNRMTTDPKLGALKANGGPTKTVAIAKQSPAVNHGTKPAPKRDQRGKKRDNKPDIGAYELVAKKHH